MAAKDPADRSAIARIAAFTRASKHDGLQVTAAARRVNNEQRYLDQVDPQRLLPDAERQRRADAARRARMLSLARLSAQARRKRLPQGGEGPAVNTGPSGSEPRANRQGTATC